MALYLNLLGFNHYYSNLRAMMLMENLAPILLFTFNRPRHTRETVEHLLKNREARQSILYVFSDGTKNEGTAQQVRKVRNYLKSIKDFREIQIIERESNYGLARSIREGVSEILSKHGRVIVLEDDLVTSPYFLKYMNEALEMYANDSTVASIHGYCYPVRTELPDSFFLKGADCWGWGTWERAWKTYDNNPAGLLKSIRDRGLSREFNLNNRAGYTRMLKRQMKGRIDSWAITWYASCFLEGMYTLYPYPSLIINIGHDSTGTHSGYSKMWGNQVSNKPINLQKLEVQENPEAREAFEDFFRRYRNLPGLVTRIINKIIPLWK